MNKQPLATRLRWYAKSLEELIHTSGGEVKAKAEETLENVEIAIKMLEE